MKPKPLPEDTLVMGPDLGQGRRPYVRQNEEGVGFGVMRPVKDGEPLTEDAFVVEHQGPGPVYKVTPVFEKSSKTKPATPDYRKGWDRIFGRKQTVGQA